MLYAANLSHTFCRHGDFFHLWLWTYAPIHSPLSHIVPIYFYWWINSQSAHHFTCPLSILKWSQNRTTSFTCQEFINNNWQWWTVICLPGFHLQGDEGGKFPPPPQKKILTALITTSEALNRRTFIKGGAHMHWVNSWILTTFTQRRMSPTLNGSSVLQHFKCGNAIKIRNGIMFDFYQGLPHIPSVGVLASFTCKL